MKRKAAQALGPQRPAILVRRVGQGRRFQVAQRPLPSASGLGRSPVERKVSDTVIATYQVNTTGSITLLHVPTLGTDFTNRIGRKTAAKSIYVRGFVRTEASGTAGTQISTVPQQCRMILFADLQPSPATAIAVTDLLVSAHPAEQLNLNNRDRFRILADKMYVLDPYVNVTTATQAQASLVNQIRTVKVFKKINIETIFNGTNGGTFADITSGAIYMLWIGNVAAGANTDANAILTVRVRFIDS